MDKTILPIVFRSSKRKLIVLMLTAVLFIAMSVWMLILADDTGPFHPLFMKITGMVGILFFGLSFFYLLRATLDGNTGLRLDSAGITDNSNALSVGLIEWKDVTKIEIKSIASNRFLMIHVSNPEKYIAKARGPLRKWAMKGNMKLAGSPLAISDAAFKCPLEEMEKQANLFLTQYG